MSEKQLQPWVREFRPRLWAYAYPQVGRSMPWARARALGLWTWLMKREAMRRGKR